MTSRTAVPAVDEVRGLGDLRLTARGRRALVALAVLVLSASLMAWGAGAVADAPGRAMEVQLRTVAPGETLWQYAESVAEPGDDLRDVVAELKELNGLRTTALQVGQVVVLPGGGAGHGRT
ncbi:LysM peptidoglycan-binding domain-containing protein [Isoptericola halotolerans]|uniref:LysM peptidoglycan-binding domain-containing protein n=1 Tax=Isoptericola halotolerans TaxID=300560 RepID=UPI00388F0CCE